MIRLLPTAATLVVLLLLHAVSPPPAHAWKWLGWLDELSGPGPFKGATISQELWCLPQPARVSRASISGGGPSVSTGLPGNCRFDRADTKVALHFEYSPRMDDRPKDHSGGKYSGDTDLAAYRAIVYTPVGLGRGLNTRLGRVMQRVEVGAGVGAYHVSGNTLTDSPMTLWVAPVRVRVIPVEVIEAFRKTSAKATFAEASKLRQVLRAIEYRGGADIMLSDLNPNDFQQPKPKAGRFEMLWTSGFQVDALVVLKAIFEHK